MSQEADVVRWFAIDPDDREPLEFNFSLYSGGLPVDSATVEVELMRGSDPTPSNVLQGSLVISGAVVYQRVHQAVNGAIYKFRCRGVFTDGRAKVLAGILPCVRR